MDSELQAAVVEVMYFAYSKTSNKKAVDALKKLEAHLRNDFTDTQRDFWVLENHKQIARLHGALSEHKREAAFISFNDRVLKKLLRFDAGLGNRVDIPALFADFIKGITYFSSEEEQLTKRPLYHRLYSCGERGDALYETLHRCIDGQRDDDRRSVEERITKCYIERLIFDEIYKHNTFFFPLTGTEVHSQNQGHLDRNAMTYSDYRTCFPNIELSVNVDFMQTVPYSLTLIKKINGKIRFVEVYTKDPADPNAPVRCIITKSSGVYVRYNTFDAMGRTVKIDAMSDQ